VRVRACRSVRVHYTGGLRVAHVTKVLHCGHELSSQRDVKDIGLETFHAAVEEAAVGGAYFCQECPDEEPPELPPAVAGPPPGPESPGSIPRTTKRPL